jgi:predicted metal-dependent TIM-barrel fold hydrolase
MEYIDIHAHEFEPNRAKQYGIRHYTWLCLKPEEAENRELAREVLSRMPKYPDRPTVPGIGEIGLNRVARNELATFRDHVDLAV